MKKSWKMRAFFAALTAMVTALPLTAQSPDPLPVFPEPTDRVFPIIDQEEPFPQSASSKVTNRNVAAGTDNFMSPFYYQLVDYKKFFAFMGLMEGKFAAGYAGRLGRYFLGLYYHGNILKQGELNEKPPADSAAQKTETEVPGAGSMVSYNRREIFSDNRAEVFLGNSRGMAFKIGFQEKLISSDGTPALNPGAPQKNYSYLGGDIRPYLGWGMTLRAGKYEILPSIDFALDLFRDSGAVLFDDRLFIGQAQQAAAGKTTYSSGLFLREASREGSMISPVFGAGFELAAPLQYGQQAFGLKYSGGMAFYSNNYDVYGTKGNIKGSMAWTNKTTVSYDSTISEFIKYVEDQTLTLSRISASRHTITPVYRWFSALSERAVLGVNLSAAVDMRKLTQDKTQSLTTHTLYLTLASAQPTQSSSVSGPVTIDNYSSSALSISPAINIGASYAVAPGIFTINTGLKLNPPQYIHTVIRGKRSTDIAGASVPVGYTTDLSVWTPFSAAVSAGFVLSFSSHLAFDAVMSSGTITFNQGNRLPSSEEGIDLSRIALLMTLKF
ncbi:MAG: hypothetical protein LBP42_04400 [Treponema sp.]|jgi:hypothetical protein|nr:hypothetical protein [Treponema sp.]